ncbi:hypothetical protein [Rubellimicrobium sp. CFH 75288]|uniref:hypothetical protein n=1 Tax=Rubellimicrobium sp. CFH 75288 TaxID=2697034 RepID=UPI001411D082|nr:hypothetical protein [Rubellimicrobium sp. CFH 75288]NAZ35540.1 hypothetical protein [Rubellimicrobium sp. CFH 75288]
MTTPSRPSASRFRVDETRWGYVIRAPQGVPVLVQVAQGVVLAAGSGLSAAAVLLVLAAEGDGMTTGLAVLCAAAAALLLRFALCGATVELQVDLARGELRETLRHCLGRTSVIGRHGLGAGASLAVQPGDGGVATLWLRLGTNRRSIRIAQGPEPVLQALKRRLDGDLLAGCQTILRPAPEAEGAAGLGHLDRRFA